MKLYLYIPEDLDASEHLITAAQNNIDQIIHGPSDILKDVKYNHNEVSTINVPEAYGAWLEREVGPENSEISIIFMDEWAEQKEYVRVFADVYKIDLNNFEKNVKIESVDFSPDGKYSYYYKFKFKEMGEYKINLMAEIKNTDIVNISNHNIIIFRELNDR